MEKGRNYGNTGSLSPLTTKRKNVIDLKLVIGPLSIVPVTENTGLGYTNRKIFKPSIAQWPENIIT